MANCATAALAPATQNGSRRRLCQTEGSAYASPCSRKSASTWQTKFLWIYFHAHERGP
jgi:hypothetical protein